MFSGTAHDAGRILFLGENYTARRDGLNVASDTVRDQHILSSLGVATSGGTTVGSLTKHTSVSVTHGSAGATAQATVWQDSNQTARLFAFGDLFVAGGKALSGTLAGTFEYEGVFVSALNTALGAVREGTFTLLANFTDGNFTFTGTTNTTPSDSSTTQSSRLAVTTGGTVNASTGILLATAAAYTDGTGTDKSADARLDGRVLGVGGVAVAGLFTTTQSGTRHVGGFVGGAPVLAQVLADPDNGLRIGTAREGVRGTSGHGRGSLFLSSSTGTFDTQANALNVASDTVRGDALLVNLRAALTGGAPVPNTGISKYTLSSSNKITYGSDEAATGVVFGNSALGLRLVAVDGFIAAGGTLLTAAISGTFTYSGAFVSAASGSLGSALRDGTFDLVADLSGASSTHYFTLDAQTVNAGGDVTSQLDVTQANGGTINATTGAFSATAASFIEGAGSTDGIPALVHGRILSDGEGVAGLFTTTRTGTIYAGGFVGGAPQIVSSTTTLQGGGAFGVGNVTLDSDATKSRVVFVTGDYSALADEANVSSDSARAGNLLDAIDTTAVGSGATITRTPIAETLITTSSGGSFAYKSGRTVLGVHEARDATYGTVVSAARLFALDSASSLDPDGESLLAYTVTAHTGPLLAGTYTWRGVQLSGVRTALQTTKQALFELTGTIGADGTASLDYTTIGASPAFTLSGDVTLSAEGILAHDPAGTGLDFDPDGGDTTLSPVKVLLRGELAGRRGAGLAGLFATNTPSGTQYAGGFLGAGPARATVDTGVALALSAGIITGNFAFDGEADAQPLFVISRRTTTLLTGGGPVNSPHHASSDESLLNSLGVFTSTGDESDASGAAARQETGTLAFDGTTVPTVRLSSRDGAARALFVVVGRQKSIIAAGGTAFTHTGTANAGDISGIYTYEGAQSLAELDSDYASPVFGDFSLTLDFDNENATYTGQAITIGSAPDQVTATLGAASTDLSLASVLGTISGAASLAVGGASIPAVIRARLHGDYATAVSGVFATTGSSGDQYAGGFVGGGPILASEIAAPENGLRIGTAREDVSGTSGHGRGSLFLSSRTATFDTHANALNVASDTLRGDALLVNLRDALAGGASVPDTGISKYTLSSSNKITYGSSEAATGVVFGDSVLGLRLVAVDGFVAAGGTLLTDAISGTFRYSGAFVSAASGSLGSALRDGTFDLVASLAGADSTHHFTLDAQTVNAGGTVTSQIDVTQANGGTINATTGAFSTTEASFIEGAESTGGIQALVHGRILSGGQGVAGLFTTTQAGTVYAGGFVGGAPILAQSLANPANGLRIGTAREDVRGTSGHGRGSLFLSSSATTFDTHMNALNVASDTVRGNALLANLRNALTGGAPVPDTGISKYTLSPSNKITYGSDEAVTGVVFGDSDNGPRLVAVDGFIAAGGTLLTATISGTYRYRGAFVSAASGSLGSALRDGTFNLLADLSGAGGTHYFTLDALTTDAGGDVTSQIEVNQANGGTINATTGVFSATAASFIEGAGSGGGIAALVHGRILSGGEGVAGLFTTTQTGTVYAGGFVGGAPILVQDLANPANGLRIGTAREDVRGTSGDGREWLFLSSSETTFDTHANALNVASDTLRGNALLANLRDALTGGVPVPDTGISKYTLSSSNKITYGSSEATTGVVFGDSGIGLRLVAVDGFIAAGGTLLTATISGTFQYSGAFVSAASGSLGNALREGTLDLVAELSGAADTHYFTLDAQTVNAGGTVTSQLDVTQANGGSINATTGAFSSTAASFIEGAESTGGIPALVHGRILSGGEGVAGLFTTTQTGTVYAGGFVGRSKSDVATALAPVSGRKSGLGTLAERKLGAGTANGIAVVGDDYAPLVDGASAASETTRNSAFLAGLSPTGFGDMQAVGFADGITTHLEGRAYTRTGGGYNSGGNFPATEWTNFGGQARLVLFDGSGVTGSGARGSFLAAGGSARPTDGVLSGGFTWAGALVLGEADGLDGTPEIGRFTLRYDFASSDAVKGSLEGAFADTPGNDAAPGGYYIRSPERPSMSTSRSMPPAAGSQTTAPAHLRSWQAPPSTVCLRVM